MAVVGMQNNGNEAVNGPAALQLALLKQQLIYVADNHQLDLQHPDVLKLSAALDALIVQYMKEFHAVKRSK